MVVVVVVVVFCLFAFINFRGIVSVDSFTCSLQISV